MHAIRLSRENGGAGGAILEKEAPERRKLLFPSSEDAKSSVDTAEEGWHCRAAIAGANPRPARGRSNRRMLVGSAPSVRYGAASWESQPRSRLVSRQRDRARVL